MKKDLKLYNSWYGTFLLNEFDYVQKTIIHGNWEPHIQNIYEKFLTKESVAIDVGAHIGFHSKRMADYAKKVYAFEPQKSLYHQLCANITLNDYSNKVECVNIALGETQKTTSFALDTIKILPQDQHLGEYNLGGKSLDDSLDYGNVQVRTLDSFNLNPDFIKVDIEGYELQFLQGAIQTLLKHQPLLVIEIFPETFDLISSFFKGINYELIETNYHTDYIAVPTLKISLDLIKKSL